MARASASDEEADMSKEVGGT